MINKILPFLNRLLPTKLAYDALQKANPKLKKFATGAIASGYTIDQTMDFLRDRFLPEENKEGFGQRPDEKAAAQQVENSKQLPRALMTGASLAGGALGGLAAMGMGGGNQQNQGIRPDEITQQPRQPLQVSGRQPLGITEQNQGIPQEGSTIVPPIYPHQQQQAKKQGALQKFKKHQKPRLADELYDQFQEGYGNKQQDQKQQIDQAILESLSNLLNM